MVTVTDANGCTMSTDSIVDTITITQPLPYVVTLDSINVSCFGFNDGAATIGVNGNNAPYTFVWSDGQTTPTAAGLVAGIYYATVTDANGCVFADSINGSIVVNQPSQLVVTYDSTNVSCTGLSDGVIGS